MLLNLASLLFAAGAASAATVWSGSFNGYSTATDFDKWSWSNQVGAYQWYIHGSQPTTRYLALSSSYKNPAQTTENQGLKLTIDSTSRWNGQTMWRTELIPQTSVSIATGQMYYHFSLKRTNTNPPRSTYEHQVVFFESHFTELKYGVGSNPSALQWFVGGVSKWSTAFNADTWYNFAYDINFSSGTVGLWASTGSSPLVKVVNNISASTSSNSADWHLGVLAFGSGDAVEDWYFSGVYVENGSITTSVGSGQQTTGPTTQVPTSTTVPATTSTTTTTTASGPQQTQWGQCGGINWTGPTSCVSPFTCKVINDYYYQCQ